MTTTDVPNAHPGQVDPKFRGAARYLSALFSSPLAQEKKTYFLAFFFFLFPSCIFVSDQSHQRLLLLLETEAAGQLRPTKVYPQHFELSSLAEAGSQTA